MAGEVEADETYVGRVERGVIGRQTKTKAIVVIAAEVAGAGIGRIRMSPVPDVSARSLGRSVRAAISDSSVVHTDGWRGYSGLKRRGYQHRPKNNIAAIGDPAHVGMPRVHRVASLLKR
jgi:transposase-like protein